MARIETPETGPLKVRDVIAEQAELEPRITIAEAARLMHVTPMFLRLAIQKGLYDFGVCLQQTGPRYTYCINRARFMRFLNGEIK